MQIHAMFPTSAFNIVSSIGIVAESVYCLTLLQQAREGSLVRATGGKQGTHCNCINYQYSTNNPPSETQTQAPERICEHLWVPAFGVVADNNVES